MRRRQIKQFLFPGESYVCATYNVFEQLHIDKGRAVSTDLKTQFLKAAAAGNLPPNTGKLSSLTYLPYRCMVLPSFLSGHRYAGILQVFSPVSGLYKNTLYESLTQRFPECVIKGLSAGTRMPHKQGN